LNTCATNLTEYMAQRYLDMNPDIQHSIGRGGKGAQTLARDHYKDIGFAEKRSIAVPRWDKMFDCGDTDEENVKESCKCQGTLHMGYSKAPDSGNDLDTFEKMREWRTHDKKTDARMFSTCER
jgi:hypothetical protein